MFVPEIVVFDPDYKHEYGHHQETQQLDVEPADLFDESDSEPVSRKRAQQGDKEHRTGCLEHFGEGINAGCLVGEAHSWEYVLLGQVLAVEGYVEQEPSAHRADQVAAMSAEEFWGEQFVVVGCLELRYLVVFGLDF